ncbi:Lrp/AsnC family transcriptional regulator [Shewanella pealeana]|uniref:Transcriptional regulator, AsnC family n=1 Tax=Shewanella pealeana (strain ATCC 700345 / ANG-SQ1) TaxID=398579 RepID=A8H9J7_SHEPA|nr:Lrp/AsnC family transcriptional regulator [Shewanella pealeana]ABV89234.1 transcriptional regulator, AsnC family [Shewanella pealeana ATCC 700345]
MDNKDRNILAILQRQGRIAISELAARLNMSDTPCLRRVRKLEQTGVISGYGAQIDPKEVGLNVVVYAFVRLKENSDQYAILFEESMENLEQVMECSVVTGAHDYLLKIVASDLLSYESFVKKSLGSLNCIAGIESTVVLKQNFSRNTLPL